MAVSAVASLQRPALRREDKMRAVAATKNRDAVEPLAFTIEEFADAYRLSRATVYNLWRDGAGPARMRVRGRVLISREAAENWRREVEQEAAA